MNSDAFWVHECKCTHISANVQTLGAQYICLCIQRVWHSISLCLYRFIYEMCMRPSPAGLYFLKQQSICLYVCVRVCIPSRWSRNHVQHLYLCAAHSTSILRHTHTCVYTATSFSSDCSPSGRAPRIPGRRARVRGLPSSARQPGTRPCFLYGSRTQRCPLRRAPPPPESWETDERKSERELSLKITRDSSQNYHRGAVTGLKASTVRRMCVYAESWRQADRTDTSLW